MSKSNMKWFIGYDRGTKFWKYLYIIYAAINGNASKQICDFIKKHFKAEFLNKDGSLKKKLL